MKGEDYGTDIAKFSSVSIWTEAETMSALRRTSSLHQRRETLRQSRDYLPCVLRGLPLFCRGENGNGGHAEMALCPAQGSLASQYCVACPQSIDPADNPRR